MLLTAGRISLPFITSVISILIFVYLSFEQLETIRLTKYGEKIENVLETPPVRVSSHEPSHDTVGMNEYMSDILKWERPKDKDGHWPQYSAFEGRDYDPNRWEGFPLCVYYAKE
jgi:hypothetical protein